MPYGNGGKAVSVPFEYLSGLFLSATDLFAQRTHAVALTRRITWRLTGPGLIQLVQRRVVQAAYATGKCKDRERGPTIPTSGWIAQRLVVVAAHQCLPKLFLHH